jgi:hypothetical protein
MGKKKGASVKYSQRPVENPRARESDGRRLQQLHNLEVKRLLNSVERHESDMMRWIPRDKRKRQRIGKAKDFLYVASHVVPALLSLSLSVSLSCLIDR